MARLVAALFCETDAVMDDVRRLVGVHAALAHRHGAAFRALDRDIERLLDEPFATPPAFAELCDEDGLRLIMITPPQILRLLDRAVALGVRPAPIG